MYVDSYFSYFTAKYSLPGGEAEGLTWTIGKTLIPIFYEAAPDKIVTRYGYTDWTHDTVISNTQ